MSKRVTPQKSGYLSAVVADYLRTETAITACLACKWLQIGTDMLLIITNTGDEFLRNVNIDDLEP